MRLRALRLPLMALLLLPSCADIFGVDEQDKLRRRLDAAEQRWESEGTDDYSFILYRSCFCGDVGPVQIRVEDDVIVEVRRIPSGEILPPGPGSSFPTIRGIFAILREAIDLPASDVQMEFNLVLGYPRDVYLDWYGGMADDEIRYEVSAVEPLHFVSDARVP